MFWETFSKPIKTSWRPIKSFLETSIFFRKRSRNEPIFSGFQVSIELFGKRPRNPSNLGGKHSRNLSNCSGNVLETRETHQIWVGNVQETYQFVLETFRKPIKNVLETYQIFPGNVQETHHFLQETF